jgi:prepilin-type processing-associated H-X9-DG protein
MESAGAGPATVVPQIQCPSHPWAGRKDIGDNGMTFYVALAEADTVYQSAPVFTSTGSGVNQIRTYRYPAGNTSAAIISATVRRQMTTVNQYRFDRGVVLADVSDGTSTTAMIGERGPDSGRQSAGWAFAPDATFPNAVPTNAAVYVGMEANAPWYTTTVDADWDDPASFCPDPGLFVPSSLTSDCPANAVSSFHPGGGYFVFVDGHVRFLTFAAANKGYDTDPYAAPAPKSVLQQLVTRNAGEQVPEGF